MSLVQAPVKPKLREADQSLVRPTTKITPTPAEQKASVSIAQQIVVPLTGQRSIKVDGSIPVRVGSVPSWCIMYTSNNN